ncbi:MAG: DUF3606 domain-containing protein [Pirellulaceae bacterium]
MQKSNLASIPTSIDLAQEWLVEYWAVELGVSRGRLAQAVGIVGPEVAKLRKYLKDGHRIAVRDDSDVVRLVARITLEKDGFAASVPYHPAKKGWIWELPLDYSKFGEVPVPLSEAKHYTVDDTVKLSMHMGGFVQFSRGGAKPIVSGYNPELAQINPDYSPVNS